MGFVLYRSDNELRKLWNDFSSLIFPLCSSYMRSPEASYQALINVFVEAMKYEHDFEDDTAAKNWLIICTERVCRNMLNGWWRYSDSEYELPSDAIVYDHEGFFDELAALPHKYKLALFLKYHEGLSTEEIGRLLKASQHIIRSRLHNAKAFINNADSFPDVQAFKAAYDSVVLPSHISQSLCDICISQAHDEEFDSNILPEEAMPDEGDPYQYSFRVSEDFDDRAESIALLKANFPKLIPGFLCIIAIIIIMIMYFIKNPM
ncbi:MAG: sigma-70 family RNA polymerase sigma factor [Lachnospiraceae bacterium]|nr:sigma-70 family RNA polymerase sigma factor [Lachnospiraceae bacterium]